MRLRHCLIMLILLLGISCLLKQGYAYWTEQLIVKGNAELTMNVEIKEEIKIARKQQKVPNLDEELPQKAVISNPIETLESNVTNGSERPSTDKSSENEIYEGVEGQHTTVQDINEGKAKDSPTIDEVVSENDIMSNISGNKMDHIDVGTNGLVEEDLIDVFPSPSSRINEAEADDKEAVAEKPNHAEPGEVKTGDTEISTEKPDLAGNGEVKPGDTEISTEKSDLVGNGAVKTDDTEISVDKSDHLETGAVRIDDKEISAEKPDHL